MFFLCKLVESFQKDFGVSFGESVNTDSTLIYVIGCLGFQRFSSNNGCGSIRILRVVFICIILSVCLTLEFSWH